LRGDVGSGSSRKADLAPAVIVNQVRHAVCLANIGTYSDPRAAIRVAQQAEASGWDGIFLWDHLAFVWGAPAADPWTTVAAIAASTERLLLGTAVTPLPRRRPQVVAHQVATLDVLSGGRMVFGAGLGGSVAEFARFGEPADARVRAEMLDEGLDVIRRLWSGDEVTHRGAHYTVDAVKLAPTPVQNHLPIWIGGNRRASQSRAARWDGWIPDTNYPPDLGATPEKVADGIERIREARDGEAPFEVAVLAESGKADPTAYEQAGATWWLENVHDRRGSPEEVLQLVGAGPPAR
jgi:probable F420-dependent oxidoreductase